MHPTIPVTKFQIPRAARSFCGAYSIISIGAPSKPEMSGAYLDLNTLVVVLAQESAPDRGVVGNEQKTEVQ